MCRNRRVNRQMIQTASKAGNTESVDEDRNYEKVCFTGPRAIISIG
jgi:hypothetical protein